MKTRLTAVAVTVFACAGMALGQAVQVGPGTPGEYDYQGMAGVLWDNGDTNGANGVSHLGDPRRTILEDFTVGDAAGWSLDSFTTVQIWVSGAGPGTATGYELTFWSDLNGAPDAPFATANVTGFSEVDTLRDGFGRSEMGYTVDFDPIVLGQGDYWVEMHVLGPENSFQMVRDLPAQGSQLWVNYDDLGGLLPGSDIFGGVEYHVAFTLGGDVVPAPASLALLGLGGLAAIRRRRC